MQVEGHDDVWAIGDCAAVPDPANPGQSCPPTAQHAMRQDSRVAGNVAAALGHGERRRFTFKTLGLVVDLGRRRAIGSGPTDAHGRDRRSRRVLSRAAPSERIHPATG
jgi:NADH:quinone reductase (non-electrogenic)